MKKGISGVMLLFFTTAAFAVDFGLVLGADGEYTGAAEGEGFSLTAYASPWVSAAWDEGLSFHVSGKLAYEYKENREPAGNYFFELERTEFNLRPASSLYISLGRRRFQDALGMVASGLFDGAGGDVQFGVGRLSLGVFYTGLLYKESAKILMSAEDLREYEKPLAGVEGYFATRRVVAALTGEFPDLLSGIGLTAQGLAQFDVNGRAEALYTQYLELRCTAELGAALYVEAGALGELVQGTGGIQGSAAGKAMLDWEVPGALNDLLSAKFLWTSGSIGGGMCAYIPVGGLSAGGVFDPGLRAIMNAALSYRARPLGGISAGAGAGYFIRTDLESLGDGELDAASESRLLGGELTGSLLWAPDPALMVNVGGGAFFPGWGGAFREGAPVRWKVNLQVIVSL
ncbi:MAG: hypothetical protein LBL56_03730 [Treponema sp.]|jgi:hypothetical protein|nr:hypothetical protein [Treponema sp.]